LIRPFAVSASASAGEDFQKTFAASCVKNTGTGDVILKFVNVSANAVQAHDG
jgi:hypothetical protein